MTVSREGGCLCRDTRYRVDGEPMSVCFCHCESCRRASGGAYVPWATFRRPQVEFTGAEPAQYPSSQGVIRMSCARCSSALTYEQVAEPTIDLTVATFDDPSWLEPTCHIWVSDKLPGIEIADDLPQYPEWRSAATGENGD